MSGSNRGSGSGDDQNKDPNVNANQKPGIAGKDKAFQEKLAAFVMERKNESPVFKKPVADDPETKLKSELTDLIGTYQGHLLATSKLSGESTTKMIRSQVTETASTVEGKDPLSKMKLTMVESMSSELQQSINDFAQKFGEYEQEIIVVRNPWNLLARIGLVDTHGKELADKVHELMPDLNSNPSYLLGKSLDVIKVYLEKAKILDPTTGQEYIEEKATVADVIAERKAEKNWNPIVDKDAPKAPPLADDVTFGPKRPSAPKEAQVKVVRAAGNTMQNNVLEMWKYIHTKRTLNDKLNGLDQLISVIQEEGKKEQAKKPKNKSFWARLFTPPGPEVELLNSIQGLADKIANLNITQKPTGP